MDLAALNDSYVELKMLSTIPFGWLSACQGKKEPFKDHLNAWGCLTSLRNKSQQSSLGNFQCALLLCALVLCTFTK